MLATYDIFIDNSFQKYRPINKIITREIETWVIKQNTAILRTAGMARALFLRRIYVFNVRYYYYYYFKFISQVVKIPVVKN